MIYHRNPHGRLTDAMHLELANIHLTGRSPVLMLNAQQTRFRKISEI